MRRKKTLILLFIFNLLITICPTTVKAEETVVRVGFFESTYNILGSDGRRSGYAYDYLQEIAAHSGWTYEYVDGTWTELMEMLEKGEIDVISDVSYLPEREDSMLFSMSPMGSELYYIYADSSRTDIDPNDLRTLDGKRIGTSGFSIEWDVFLAWSEMVDIQMLKLEYEGDDKIAQAMLNGEIDAFIATDAFMSLDNCETIAKIGSSEVYFAINKNRPDLKEEMDSAMREIESENPYFQQELSQTYLMPAVSRRLPQASLDWLEEHGTIRIGYRDDYMAFCGTDEETGELTGALTDYLEAVSECFSNAEITFEPVAYDSVSEAITALKNGEVDCVFPSNLCDFHAEEEHLFTTSAMFETDLYAVVRDDSFSLTNHNVVAMGFGNPNYLELVQTNFPDWEFLATPDIYSCFQAIQDGNADCYLISYYRYNTLKPLIEEYGLTCVPTGSTINLSFAVRREDSALYSILNRAIILIPSTNVNSFLSKYDRSTESESILDFAKDHFLLISSILIVFILIISVMLLRTKKAEKRAQITLKELQQADMDRRTDFLTGLRNRQDMFEVLQEAVDCGDNRIKAMYLMDIDNFKSYNDNYGHVEGDKCLITIASALLAYGKSNNITFFRYGGEEILGVLFDDSRDMDVIAVEIVNLVNHLELPRDDGEMKTVTVSVGYTTNNKRYEKMIDMADEAMYVAKKRGKNQAVAYEKLNGICE